MFLLQPIKSEKVWGYELWIASTHPNGCQADFLQATGGYPLLVKVIQADDTLSVQVHPDDATAVALEGAGALGKTECWYVLDAAPNAQLVYGLRGSYGTEALRAAISEHRLEACLNRVNVRKGDFIFIPAGTVHAIGGGLRLLEVQQSCDITYRLYDWGRPRELHVEKGLASIRQTPPKPIAPLGEAFECDYFTLRHDSVAESLSWRVGADDGSAAQKPTGAAWQLVFVAGVGSGGATIRATSADGTQTAALPLRAEQMYALAPDESVTVDGSAELVRIAVKA